MQEGKDWNEGGEIGFIFGKETKKTNSIVEGGCYHFLLGDVLGFLGVPRRCERRAITQELMGAGKIKRFWFSSQNKERRGHYIHLGYIKEYVNLMKTTLSIDEEHVKALEIWLEGLSCECRPPVEKTRNKKRKRRDEGREEEESDRGAADEEGEQYKGEDNCNNKNNNNDEEEDYCSFDFNSDIEEEEEENRRVVVNVSKRQQLMKLSSYIIASGAEVLRMLPPEDTKQKASVLAEMLNQFEILKSLHPLRDSSDTPAIPSYPPTGSQIRVSDRLRVHGIDPKTVEPEKYMLIGEIAAQKFRACYGMAPWKVPVWVGNERKSTHFYTESTREFIDEAIEEILKDL